MKNKIYIDVHQNRSKVAITENGELAEFYVEQSSSQKLVGNIYKGKVVNVLPGMQAAFVDIGLEKNAYLYVGNSMVERDEMTSDEPIPQELGLKIGDSIMVQIIKEQFGTKGVRIATEVSLPGRYVVYVPNSRYIGVSKKIQNEDVKERLIASLKDLVDGRQDGFVIRTAAANISSEILRKEAQSLMDLYEDICTIFQNTYDEVALIHEEDDLIMRVIRDMYNDDTEEIYVNSASVYKNMMSRFATFTQGKEDIIKLYNGYNDMYDEFNLSRAIEGLLKRKVPLKNGAYLVFDRTEALTVIDVNTGKFVGGNNLEQTVYETNILAAETIAKQLRLRNIGGIIIVDFIDMDDDEHREKVVDYLKEKLKADRISTSVVGITGLGLVELTRKKTRSMIDSVLLQPCPYCDGDSYVYSSDYMIMRVREGLYAYFDAHPNAEVITVTVHPTVFGKLFSTRELENECETRWQGRRIYILPDHNMHVETYVINDCGHGVVDIPDTAKLLY